MTNYNKLLVIDTSYTYQMITERKLFGSVTCRDLDGFFEHVWSVHPFASLLNTSDWDNYHGRETFYQINSRHTFIEGKFSRYKFLRSIPPFNFLLAQIHLFFVLYSIIKRENIIFKINSIAPIYIGVFVFPSAKKAGWQDFKMMKAGIPKAYAFNA